MRCIGSLLLVLSLLLSACQAPKPLVTIPRPKAEVVHLDLCEVKAQWLNLASLTTLKACKSPIILREQQLNLLLASSEPTPLSAKISTVTPQQWRQGERPPPLALFNSFADYAKWVDAGLSQLDKFGVLLQPSGVAGAPDTLATMQLAGLDWPQGLLQGNTLVSATPDVALQHFSASFDETTLSRRWAGGQLPVAPYTFTSLRLSICWRVDQSAAKPAILVKQWRDMNGNNQRQSWSLHSSEPCQTIVDHNFDTALASAYYVNGQDSFLSSPIWYAPLKG